MGPDALLLVVAGGLLLARTLFVAADAALSGLSVERAEEIHRARPTLAASALLRLKRDFEGTAATVRGGQVATLACGAALAGAATARLLQTYTLLGDVLAASAGGVGAAAAIFLLDLLPRSLAYADPERLALRVCLPTSIAARLIGPPARALAAVANLLLRPFGARATFRPPAPALEDLERYLVEQSDDEDSPAPELVHSLFEFSTTIAREVMVPRTEVVAVPLCVKPDELVQRVAESGHSRLPVYEGEIDRIVGVIHTRDLVPLLAHPELIRIEDIIRPPAFVPWATRIGRLLREMQRDHIHMAMVTDEHGGFMGIVTLEDIIEEIVGDIQDEHDAEERDIEPLADGALRVNASVTIAEFNETLGVELPDDGSYDTLAGFLNQLAGAIPDEGATLAAHGLTFLVEERTPRRVIRVLVRPQAVLQAV